MGLCSAIPHVPPLPLGRRQMTFQCPPLTQAGRPMGTCSIPSRETVMPPAPGDCETPKPKRPPRHPPQKPAAGGTSTPLPPSPGPSQIGSPPGKACLLPQCGQFCLEPSLYSKARPRARDPAKRAQSTVTNWGGRTPHPKKAEEGHGGPTRVYGVGTEGPVGRVAHEAEDMQGACPDPLHRASPSSSRRPCHSNQSQTSRPPGNECSGTLGSEGCNLDIAHNNPSLGRNGTLGGGKHLVGLSDHLKGPS